jgi:hypothetical protein
MGPNVADKPKWVTSAKLEPVGGARIFFGVLFFIWGGLGLLINIAIFLSMPSNVGVGTSAYVAASILLWIGGMVLFGFAALIYGRHDFSRPET